MCRLYVTEPLADGGDFAPGKDQSHYLLNVMRLTAGEEVLLFNGREGEW